MIRIDLNQVPSLPVEEILASPERLYQLVQMVAIADPPLSQAAYRAVQKALDHAAKQNAAPPEDPYPEHAKLSRVQGASAAVWMRMATRRSGRNSKSTAGAAFRCASISHERRKASSSRSSES